MSLASHCRVALVAALVLSCSAPLTAAAAAAAAVDSPPPTLRVDYFHTGNAREERFALDRVVLEPLPWPGMPERAIDETNLGKYFFEVVDRVTRRVLYSRGFASVYGEWETTGEAAEMDRTFSESLRFPRPAARATTPRGPQRRIRSVLDPVLGCRAPLDRLSFAHGQSLATSSPAVC